jgi:hypothetical protein
MKQVELNLKKLCLLADESYKNREINEENEDE